MRLEDDIGAFLAGGEVCAGALNGRVMAQVFATEGVEGKDGPGGRGNDEHAHDDGQDRSTHGISDAGGGRT